MCVRVYACMHVFTIIILIVVVLVCIHTCVAFPAKPFLTVDARQSMWHGRATCAGASQSGGTMADPEEVVEQRVADDGRLYTFSEFQQYYGGDGQAYWEAAKVHVAVGVPQPNAGAVQPGSAAADAHPVGSGIEFYFRTDVGGGVAPSPSSRLFRARFHRSGHSLAPGGVSVYLFDAAFFSPSCAWASPVSYTHLTLPTIYSV